MSAGWSERALGWDELIEETLPEAQRVAADTSPAGVEAWLAELASYATRLRTADVPRPELRPFPGMPETCGFALLHRAPPFLAIQFGIEPGALLPYHPHGTASVCTLLLEGSARVRNLEFVELPPNAPAWEAKGDVHLRETRSELLLPGRINLVGNPRGNIHGFRAGPEGARGVDLTTILPGETPRDSILELADEPRDPERRIFEARWRLAVEKEGATR